LRLVNRELWIVTSAHLSRRGGLLATWVSAASIDRAQPVMLVGIAPHHFTAELIDGSGGLGLHLIAPEQMGTALQFALGSGRTKDKFAGLTTTTGQGGAPLLDDCVAWFDCRVYARLATGDRTFYWCDVLAAGQSRSGPVAREQDLFGAATAEEKAQLLADRDADLARQRPLQAAWRSELPEWLKPPHGEF
jgi:flavin reductase (DIM6/NTAB) family NADH-FMN oxidoreductase RutF